MSSTAESVALPGLRDRDAVEAPGRGALAECPSLAGGVEFLGEFARSGHRRPPSLIRRADGQIIQLTPLLYEVLRQIDGRRGYGDIARAVGASAGRSITGDDIRVLTESKLRPLGVLRGADGAEPNTQKANPLLALRLRMVVTNERVTGGIAALFSWLFWPPFVLAITLLFATTTAWLLFERGLGAATRQALYEPQLLLLVFALTTLSAGFHELGHAAACRYSGAKPGAMGVGLYLVWPAFYTDVTDSYRLDRRSRLRVDLGGLYFNAIFGMTAFGLWMYTDWEALLILIALQGLQMLRQLIPLVRLDGYHILADVTGVPDLFAHIGPILRGFLPSRSGRAQVKSLKPKVRVIVTAWVVIVVPLLLFILALLSVTLPRVIATAWHSLGLRWGSLEGNLADDHFAAAGAEALAVLALMVPVLSVAYLIVRVVSRTSRRVWRGTTGHPLRRGLALVVASGLVAGLLSAWWPHGQYRPIQQHERGTIFAVPDGPWLVDGLLATIDPSWALAAFEEDENAPSVAVPVGSVASPLVSSAADQVQGSLTQQDSFQFPLPAPPGEGDNQALAVNLKDGSTLIDIALSLILTSDDLVANSNEAYALASCVRCVTVAVAFQVIVIQGQDPTVIPENAAMAINAECAACLTYAAATQLVVSFVEPLSAEVLAELRAIWQKLTALKARAQTLSLTEIDTRLDSLQEEIEDVLGIEDENFDSDVDNTATGSFGEETTASSPSASSSPTPTPTSSSSSSPSPSSSPSEEPSPNP